MSAPDDVAARARAIHAARAEVDAMLGLDPTPTTSGGVVPAAWLADARARAEKAEAERDALCAAVREWFDAEAAAEEAADVAEHACGMAGDLTRDALDKANVRRAAARTRLRALAGKGDTRGRIFAAISIERQRQDARWGEQHHPDVDRVLTDRAGGCTPARMAMEYLVARASVARQACEVAAARGQCTWAHILVEEVAELVEAATLAQQGQGPDADVDRELVQCAAVCVSWLEARARRRALARVGEG